MKRSPKGKPGCTLDRSHGIGVPAIRDVEERNNTLSDLVLLTILVAPYFGTIILFSPKLGPHAPDSD